MDKPADAAFPIDPLIAGRWSPLAFEPRPLTPEQIGSLFEAARWAPSSYNEQPWSFLVASRDEPAEFDKLLGCLAEGNRVWAKDAGLLLVSLAKLHFSKNGKPNRHCDHDVGLASMALVLQAESLGLRAHGMAGFNATQVRALYAVPATHEPVAAFAVGYQADADRLSEALQSREKGARQRRPQESFVFAGRFGVPRTA